MEANIVTAKHFKVVENSNYLVVDSYKNEYVISHSHFLSLVNLLGEEGVEFITLGNAIVNKRYIYKIEPTNRITPEEEIAKVEQKLIEEQQAKDNTKREDEYMRFSVEFMDKKYRGRGNWSVQDKINNLQEIQENFKKMHG